MQLVIKNLRKINRRMPTLIPGIILLLIIILPATAGRPFLNMELTRIDMNRLNLPPSRDYWFGTQSEGRDMFTMLVIGTWATLKVGLIGGGLGLIVGTILGLISGYFGGRIDAAINGIVDTGLTIPPLAVLILVAASFPILTIETMGIIVALTAWMQPTRVIRSQMLTLKERNFIQLAQISSLSNMEIIFREIMPNLTPFLAATFVNSVSSAILASIGLEVLGLGSQQTLSLGMTIYYSIYYSAMWRGIWWWWLPTVTIIVLIFVGLFLISLALDELGNPKLKRM